ncbi:MAG: 5-formyltetrahydrofolate cyclo-ligase [Pseudomonadota bacterium]|nr:5-formyltetrahydrofolate cyclo-ligase [Pseudomonadota bacterium]
MLDPKAALRAQLRARRAAHGTPVDGGPNHTQDGGAAALAAHLDTHAAWRSARSVAGFMAVRGELAVTHALSAARARGATVALPRAFGGRLTFHRWAGEALQAGAYGILEPDPTLPLLDPASFDVLLVPGVAFTSAGARLGQGGGYYDRVLAGPRGLAIGVAWAFQVVDAVPIDPWDQPVDALVTEDGWVLGTSRRPT